MISRYLKGYLPDKQHSGHVVRMAVSWFCYLCIVKSYSGYEKKPSETNKEGIWG